MDSSVSGKDEIWFLHVCRHVPHELYLQIVVTEISSGRSWWQAGSVAARLLGSRVRIPPGHGCLSLESVVCYQVEVSVSG